MESKRTGGFFTRSAKHYYYLWKNLDSLLEMSMDENPHIYQQ
jgi:hypothetical protein